MPLTKESLKPTPYHTEVKEYFKREEPDLWKWFSSAQANADYTESLRLNLLKSTYRLNAESHPELVQAAEEVKTKLDLNIPLTLYQAQQFSHPNAALYYIPGEAHVVLAGPLLSLLTGPELKSVLGHELAHYLLWQEEDAAYHVTDRILQAISDHPQARPSHLHTARRYCLYTEIFADRGSLLAAEKVEVVVSGLVKTQTGLQNVSGSSYLKQADEVFAQGSVKSEEVSHPETFIRVRSLNLWADHADNLDNEVRSMIEGEGTLDELDLPGQMRLAELTRLFLQQLLRPKWFQTETTLGHARLFFSDFSPARAENPVLANPIQSTDEKLQDYFASLLLDFCATDPDLEQLPIAAALKWSRKLGFEGQFQKLLSKELKVTSRQLKKLENEHAELLEKAEVLS